MRIFLLFSSLLLCLSTKLFGQLPWYHTTSIYQIYPRSFYDTNDDGIGDIQGIIQKLDYIQGLGFETIWCSPFFSSPQADFGYDVSDFRAIAPEYGTMNDVEQLIAEIHKRKMKIVFDMVMNHTSNEHPWFEEDILRPKNERGLQHDFYVWRDKPTNWKSMVNGSAWYFNEKRGQYYYAAFLPFQPDLNYHNPKIRTMMLDHVRFWLAKGVDGFRLDIFNSIYEDSLFRNNPTSLNALSNFQNKKYSTNLSQSLEFAMDLRAVCDSFGEKMLIGEIIGDRALSKKYCGDEKNNRLTLAFNFEMLRFKFNARYFEKLITNMENTFAPPFVPVYVFSNHDRRRSLSRLKGDERKAKLIHAVQFLTRGVPCVYYGEEIGMIDSKIEHINALDPVPHRIKIPRWLMNMAGETLNRDDVRTPMQWNDKTNAGFSNASKTWLPVHENHQQLNAQKAMSDTTSLYHFFKKLNSSRPQKTTVSRKGNVLFLNNTILNFNKRKSVKINGTKIKPLEVEWGRSKS